LSNHFLTLENLTPMSHEQTYIKIQEFI